MENLKLRMRWEVKKYEPMESLGGEIRAAYRSNRGMQLVDISGYALNHGSLSVPRALISKTR
jgi:hypothetical protein